MTTPAVAATHGRAIGACAAAISLSMVLSGCATAPSTTPATATRAATTGEASRERSVMVRSATAMLGQRYRYGGAAPGGFDCSGLVAYAAGSAGIDVPRTAQDQMRAGVPLPRDQLQAGDLVFMHLARKELHVGIAIDHDHFVHAPSTGGRVRIDSLSAHPYARGFLQARRIILDPATPER